MRFLPRLALLCGALLFLFGASVRPAAAQSGAIGIRGDVTADGNLTASDALAVLSHVVGKPLPAGYAAELDGDADGNGQVTALDALVILGRVVGKDVARYPVGRRLLSGVVGTAGGSVVSRLDSIRIEFPDGALAEAVNMTVEPATGLPATPGLVPGSALAIGPDGQRFAKPVRLTLRYSPAAVPQGVDPEALRIHRRVGDGWEEVPGGAVDVKSATVSALLGGFGTYAVLPRAETGLALVKVAGDNQTGTVGIPPADFLVVRLVNAAGRGVPNQLLTWTVIEGGGSIRPLEERTDSAGRVRAVFTLGPDAGVNRVRVSAAGAAPVVFTATGVSAAPSSIVVHGGADQTATAGSPVATPPSVRVTDARGNPVVDVTVTFAVATGGGSVTGATPKTDANGVATVGSWTLGTTAGPNSLTASVEGGPSVTINATGIPGAAAAISKQSGDGGTAVVATTRALEAKVVDANGNGVAGVTVSWAVATGGGSLSAPSSVTDGSGVASVVWTFGGTVGAQSVTATATGLTGSPLTFSVNTTPAAAARLAITTQPSAAAQSGIAFPAQPVLQLQDQFGNPVAQSGVAVTAALASGTGTLAGTATVNTDAAGVAAFTDLAISGPVGAYTLGFSATGLTGATSGTINLAAGAASQLSVTTQPSAAAQSGVAFPQQPAVQLRDASGNPVSQAGVTVTAAIASGGGTLGGTATATTNASGVATFTDLSISGTVGDRTLSFSASGLTSATSATISLAAGAPAQLAITTQPSATAQSGIAFPQQPAVQLRDASGNPVSQAGVTVTAAIASGGGTLGGTTTATTDAGGVATFTDLSITGTVGDRTLSFAAAGLTGATSNTISVTAGAATQLTITTQPSATAQSGTPFGTQPALQLRDASGNPVPQAGVTVTAAIATGGGTLGGTATATTNASGVATFTDLQITGTVGDRTLSFAAAGVTGATSNTISVTAGAATQLTITTQPSDSVQSGAAFPRQPVVQLRDASGNPVAQAGVTVTAAIATGGGTLGGTTTATTNAGGVATFTGLSITGTVGDRTLAFSAAGLTGATSGTISVTAGAASQLVVATQPSTTAQSGAVFGTQPAVQLQDASGNPVSQAGVTVTAAIATGGGTLGGTTTATTNGSGVATFTDLSITGTVGARTLSFAAAGLTGATSNAINITAGAATQLAITTQPSSTTESGVPFGTQPAVQLQDASGNPVSQAGVTVTAAIATGGGTLGGTTTATTNASGVATFTDLSITGTLGDRTLSFSAAGLTGATSGTVSVTAGAATQLDIATQPSSTAQSGAVFPQQPSVQLRDASGNPVSQAGVTVTAAIASGGGTLGGTTTATTNAGGVATFTDLSITGTVGDRTLSFSAAGLTGATSNTISVTAGAATQLTVTTQPSDSVQSGIAFPQQPSVQLRDASGNPVGQAGVTVTAAIATGGGTLSGTTTATTNASGVATFTDLSITGTVGDRTLSFSAAGLTGATSGSIHVRAGAASQLSITTQPSSTVQSGAAFPQQPVVQLRDASGNPVSQAGVTVTAAIASGGGTLGGTTTAVTDGNGVATFTNLSITGTLGDRTLSFSAAGLTGATSGAISVTAGAATQLDVTTQPSSTAQSGVPFPQQPVVQLRDASGNPVSQAGVTVTASIASGGGTLGGTPTATTDAGGVATFTDLSITGTLGNRTLRFSASGLADTISNTINVTAGAATQLTITTQPSDSVQSGIAFPRQPAVQLRDASGNPVSQAGVSVTAAIASGGGTLGGTATATTNAGGVATFTGLSITGTVGDRTLSFSAAGLTGATSATVSVTAGSASQLTITTQPSDSAQSGTAFPRQPAVQLRDASGNPVSQAGVSVTAAIATGGGTLGGTATATTNGSGLATFTNLSISGTAGDRTLSFSAAGLTGATSDPVNVRPGPPAQLSVTTQPSSTAQAGVAFPQQPVVQLLDASGNPATQAGVTVTASIASGAGTLGGTLTATTDAGGVATFANLSIGGTAGIRTLRFSASGLADTTSNTINVTAGPAAALAFSVQPSNVVASAAITPAVQVSVVDAFGNLVTGATDNVTLAIGNNPSGGTLSGTTTIPATGGVATFSGLSINLVGSGYTLAASSGALGAATSVGFNVTHGPLDHFLVEAAGGGPIGNQLAGTPFNVRVTAQDAYNNTVTSFTGTVGFTSTPSGGITGGHTSGAFTGGVLSSHAITFGTAGSFTLTATRTSGTESGTSNSFDVQAPPTAVNDGPAPTSAPGQPFHAFFSTSGSPVTFNLSAPGVTSNDNLGFPAATITSFGADSLGGSVTTYWAGSTVSPLPGTGRTTGALSVGADGTITFTPPDGFTGNYVFRYRLTNVRGTSDGQVTIAVGTRPAAANDTYSPVLVGNVPINTATSTQFRVTSNDAGDAKKLAITGQSNGTATLNADSTFTFRPNPGFEGTASFTYTVANGFGTSAAATVSMTVANPIWFVNAAAPAGGDGRYDAQFNSLGSLAAINNGTGSNPAASDRIFLYTGSYTGPLTLLSSQRLIGQGATASLSSIAGVTWPADAGPEPAMSGTAPTLTASGATALTLANVGSATTANNTLRGFNLGNVGAAGTALAGTSFGTVTVSEVGITTDGRALNLATGTLGGSFPALSSTGGVNNVLLTSVGTDGTNRTLGTASDVLSGATSDALKIDGGNGSFTYAGSITNAATLAVNVINKNGGAVTISGQINPAAAGRGISLGNNSSTTISFTGSAQKISTGAGAGVGLSGNNGSTISFTGGALEVATTTGNGINVNAGIAPSGGTLVITGANNTITSAGGVALNVANTTIGAGGLVFRSIAANGGTSGIVLNNTGATAGLTVTGTGAAGTGGVIQNTTSDGVRLASTRNASLNWMNFSAIASAVNNVAACNANLASGCEAAVDMDNATNVTLNRLAINGVGQVGISAHNSSGLTVTNSQVLNVGDADGESGILLHNLSGTSLIQDVTVDNPEEFGIKLFNTTGTGGLTLRRVTVQNNIGTFGEAGFQAEVSGGTTTALVDDSDFLNTDGTGVFGTSSASGVLNLTVQASVFTNNQALPSGINFTTGGTSTGRLTATGNTINGCASLCSQGIDLDASISSTLDATVLNNTITNAGIGTGIEFISNENSVARGRFEGNTVTVAADKIGFNFHSRSVASTQAGSLDLTLKSNTINGISSAAAAYGGMTFQVGSSGALVHNNSMCVNLATAQGAGSNVVNGTNNPPLIYAYTVRQRPSTVFKFQGYTGAASSATDLEAFITSNNPGGTMGGSAEVYDATATTAVNYTSGTCATPSATPAP